MKIRESQIKLGLKYRGVRKARYFKRLGITEAEAVAFLEGEKVPEPKAEKVEEEKVEEEKVEEETPKPKPKRKRRTVRKKKEE